MSSKEMSSVEGNVGGKLGTWSFGELAQVSRTKFKVVDPFPVSQSWI